MSAAADKLYKFFSKLYQLFSKKVNWILMIFILVMSAAVEFCYLYVKDPSYINFVSKVDSGNIIVIILAIWTFTVTLSTICFGKLEHRCLGIRYSDILLMKINIMRLFFLVTIIVGELFVTIVITIFDMKITLIVMTFFQFFIMIYMALMLWYETRSTSIIHHIKEELDVALSEDNNNLKSRFKYLLIVKMIKNMNYEEEASTLIEILKNGLPQAVSKENAQWVGREITRLLIQYVKKKDYFSEIIKEWFSSNKDSTDIKQGILKAMSENLSLQTFKLCQKILKEEKKDKEKLIIFFITYNIFFQRYKGEEWRIYLLKNLEIELKFHWSREGRYQALMFWNDFFSCKDEISQGEKKDYRWILSYLFVENMEEL